MIGDDEIMQKDERVAPRPRAKAGSPTGMQRYFLIKHAFAHTQAAIRTGHYIEAICVLESLLADRVGSLLSGTLSANIKLGATVGGVLAEWRKSEAGHVGVASKPTPLRPEGSLFNATSRRGGTAETTPHT